MAPERRRLAFAGLLTVVWLVAVARTGPPLGDFANYHVSALLWLEGADLGRIYDYRWFGEQATRLGWGDKPVGFPVLTPPTVLFAVPLAPLGLDSAARAWQVLQALMGLGLAVVLARSQRLPVWTGLGLLLGFWPALHAHLQQGQFHLPAVLLVASGALLLDRGRPAAAGACWGLATGLKLFAWPLLPLLLVGRQWRASVAFLAVLAVGGLASLGLVGAPLHTDWLTEIAPASASGMFMDPWNVHFQGIGTALRHALVSHQGLNPGVEASLAGAALARGLTAALPVVAVGGVLAASARWPDAAPLVRARLLGAASVAAMVSGPVISRYHLVTLIPAVYWAAAAAARGGGSARLRTAAIGLAPLLLGVAACLVPLPDEWPQTLPWLLGIPRAWLVLGLFAVLVPWGRARPAALVAVAVAAVGVGSLAATDRSVDDGARPLDHPAFPMVASELTRTDDGVLWFSGLGQRADDPGRGWVGYRWRPDDAAPAVVSADELDHRWAPTVEQSDNGGRVAWQGGAGGWRPSTAAACAGAMLEVGERDGQADILLRQPNGELTWLTSSPAWDDWPVCAADSGRIWFLSDRGVGVRALRLWWVPLPAPPA